MPHEEAVPGAIEGLRLTPRAWKVLQREKITTLDRLRAVVDRIERFETIGPKTARIVRAELRRLTFRDRPRYDSSHPAPH